MREAFPEDPDDPYVVEHEAKRTAAQTSLAEIERGELPAARGEARSKHAAWKEADKKAKKAAKRRKVFSFSSI